MPPDLSTLLHRDHADLDLELTRLLDPTTDLAELRIALDGVRLGLTAHVEAQDIVLARFEDEPVLAPSIAEAREAHAAQLARLTSLVAIPLGTRAWRAHVDHLRAIVRVHDSRERERAIPPLRARSGYGELAGRFATERLRQLAMLQPSVGHVAAVL